MRIALDAMGGDFAPRAIVEGAVLGANEVSKEVTIVLIGHEEKISGVLKELPEVPSNLEIIHAPQAIEMSEHPMKAFSAKPQSSITIGYKLLQEKKVAAFCSAGNTGAMLVGAMFSVKRKEVSRPAIMSYVPKLKGGHSVMLDVGANTDCKAETLHQFAELGINFYRKVYNVPEPRVALINVGEEEKKGNLASQAAYKLIAQNQNINFVGNIEGRDLFHDKADVLVCDGFVGNVIIKMAESYYQILKSKKIQDPFFDNFNFELIGGSPVLGIDGNVIIGHGVSNAATIKNIIFLAQKMALADL